MAENGNDGEAASAVKPEPEAPTCVARAAWAGPGGVPEPFDRRVVGASAQRPAGPAGPACAAAVGCGFIRHPLPWRPRVRGAGVPSTRRAPPSAHSSAPRPGAARSVKAEPGDRKRARPAGGDGDAVDEDKLTLAEFAQRRGITVRKELPDRGPRKPAAGAQAKERTASRRSTSRTSSASSRSGASAPAGAAPWDIRHAPDRKQHIVTRILIRWNYCIEWPNENAMLECASQRKPGFRALPGYPGIFVGVRVCGVPPGQRQRQPPDAPAPGARRRTT